MNHQQICEFVNSSDVRAYLRSVQYEFSTAEAAWLVYWCSRLTMDERHEAWREIIRDMPDCKMDGRLNLMPIESFHVFLSDYMELERRSTQEFMNGLGCVYCYEYHEVCAEGSHYRDGWYKGDTFFSNYHACIDHCKQDLGEGDGIDQVRIYQYRVDPPERPIYAPRAETLLLNRNLEVVRGDFANQQNDGDRDLASAFDGMCFDIPTPFRRGDILIDCKACGTSDRKPFVLSHITTWDSKKMLSSGFHEGDGPDFGGWERFDSTTERILRDGDFTDGHAIGTSVIDDGELFRDHDLTIPTDLAYFRDPLKGAERQLQVLSCYEKGEISGEILANACFVIRSKEYSEELCRRFMIPYTEELIERIGMLPVDKG